MIFSPAWQLWERGHLRSLSLISVGQTGGALRVKKSLGKRIPNRRASYQGLWFGDEN